jgi:hypothetical protein
MEKYRISNTHIEMPSYNNDNPNDDLSNWQNTLYIDNSQINMFLNSYTTQDYITPTYTPPTYTSPTYTSPFYITPSDINIIDNDITDNDITDNYTNTVYTEETSQQNNTNNLDIPSIILNSHSVLIDISETSDLSDLSDFESDILPPQTPPILPDN